MIAAKFQITEIDGKIEFKASGGSVGGTSKLEREFAKKFLAYVTKFNTSFTKCHTTQRVRIREVNEVMRDLNRKSVHGNQNRNRA